jgi:hypothetical protein
VEKLLYVVWKKAEESVPDFRERMLGAVASGLCDLGVRGLSMNLADEMSTFAERMRITQMQAPPSGTVSIWLDTALDRDPLQDLLKSVCQRLAGYLVLESVPLANTTRIAASGERTPGITTVAFLEKPAGMTQEDWLDAWQGRHTRVAIETQSTFLYIQNLIVRPLTEDAPPWSAIVEEGFPAEAATDPMVFFAAGDSRARLEENRRRLLESCAKFIDFARLESHPMSSYLLVA